MWRIKNILCHDREGGISIAVETIEVEIGRFKLQRVGVCTIFCVKKRDEEEGLSAGSYSWK
jgi:hypothetical protein